jgi:cell division protein WhiA
MSGGFTDEVKQELAQLPVDDPGLDRPELAALLRFGGALVVHGGQPPRLLLELETASGATARRTFRLLQVLHGHRPELRVLAPGGVRRRSLYTVRIEDGARAVAHDLDLLDRDERPAPPPTVTDAAVAAATVRGAFLAAGSISAPDRAPHLEIAAHHTAAAGHLAAAAQLLVDGTVTVAAGERPRVVVKSGATIGELLLAIGATRGFLRWDDRRLRRQVRGEATRLANADAANLRRSVEAASSQVQAVERVVAELGWDDLDEDLRAVALARLASPDASLADLGNLTDPPLSKSAVHRRMRRLERLAAGLDA